GKRGNAARRRVAGFPRLSPCPGGRDAAWARHDQPGHRGGLFLVSHLRPSGPGDDPLFETRTVRHCGPFARGLRSSDPLPTPVAQRGGTSDLAHGPQDGPEPCHGLGPLLSRPWAACPDSRMGIDARCGPRIPVACPPPRPGTRSRSLFQFFGALPFGRRPVASQRPALSVVATPLWLGRTGLVIEPTCRGEQKV